MTIKEALRFAVEALGFTESPDIDSQVLLCYVLDCQTSYLHTWPDKTLDKQQQANFLALIEQRKLGRPVAHLTGQRGFWSLDLKVTENTLIPRPDTELLVTKALEKIKDGMLVADLGTGTGAIVLSLAMESPEARFLAMDYSQAALQVAKFNAANNQINNVAFWQGDWLTAIDSSTFDIVISNPPYIESDDPHLTQGDVVFEPREALVSGSDGLDDIRQIAEQAQRCLKPLGWLLLEHGYMQAQAVKAILQQWGFEQVDCYQDYGANDRVTVGQRALYYAD